MSALTDFFVGRNYANISNQILVIAGVDDY
jgi:hypothetical protein